jgi:hypothetical protein
VQGTDRLNEAISRFGASLKPKFSGIAATGSPEDQLRGPLDVLVQDIVGALGWVTSVVLVGEASLRDLKTRPDFAVTRQNLPGFRRGVRMERPSLSELRRPG